MILIGYEPEGKHKGYLAWHLFRHPKFENYNNENNEALSSDIKELLHDESIKEQLKIYFNISEEYFLKPLMEEIKKISDSMYQAQLNRHLNLDKVEEYAKQTKKVYE